MPTTVIQLTATVDRILTTEQIVIDAVNIIAASVQNNSLSTVAASAWAEIGIKSGGIDQGNISIVLARGYIGASDTITWSGDITGDPQQFLYMNIWSEAADTFRLTLLAKIR